MVHCTSRHTGITFALISLILFIGPSTALAAEFRFRPSMAISEEYSDNINQERDKRSEFTTRVSPGLSMEHTARFWDASLNYGFEYLHYARGNKKKADGDFTQNDARHTFNAHVQGRIVPELLFLEVRNDYRRMDLNLLRSSQAPMTPGAAGGPDALPAPETAADARDPEFSGISTRERESSDRNVFTVSPYLMFRPTAVSALRTGYAYTNTWYREETVKSSHLHEAFLEGGYDLTAKFGLDAGYLGAWERISDPALAPGQDGRAAAGREDRHTPYFGVRYAYAQDSNIFARFGNTWRRFPDRAGTSDPYWSAGLTHAFAAMTASLISQVRYSSDPLQERSRREILHAATLSRPYARGAVALDAGYSEFDEPRATKVGTGVTVNHELSRRLTGTAGLAFSRRQEDRFAAGDTGNDRVKEWQARLSLTYLLGEDFTAGLNYLFTDSSSNDPFSDDNFQENRGALEVKKTF
jgi:hypothetical protein